MTTKPYQPNKERWLTFPKEVQMRHIAAELSRATSAGLHGHAGGGQEALERSLVLVDASLADPKWTDKKPLYRLRDALAALYATHFDPAVSRYIAETLLTANVP